MKKLTKIVIGLIILAIVAVVVCLAFFEKAEAPQVVVPSQSIPANWKTYTDTISGLSLEAPTGLEVATSSTGLSLIFATTTPYVHTHLLRELRIDIATPATDCVSMGGGTIGTSTIVVINGANFEREKWSDVAAGNIYQGVDYTVVRGGLCYRVTLFTHSTNGESLYTSNPIQIQKIDALQATDIKNLFTFFDQIAGTIKFTK